MQNNLDDKAAYGTAYQALRKAREALWRENLRSRPKKENVNDLPAEMDITGGTKDPAGERPERIVRVFDIFRQIPVECLFFRGKFATIWLKLEFSFRNFLREFCE